MAANWVMAFWESWGAWEMSRAYWYSSKRFEAMWYFDWPSLIIPAAHPE